MNSEDKQKEFLDLYEPSRESLVRFAKSIARNSEDAKDLVQETILTAYDKFSSLKNPKAFTSFLFTIALRIHKRKNWRRRFFANFMDVEEKEFIFDNLVSKESNPEILADINALKISLDKLPEKYKEAVILFEISGLSMEEISEIQGISISGAKSRVQRARKLLEEDLLKVKKVNSNLEKKYISDSIYYKRINTIENVDKLEKNYLVTEVIHEYR